MIYFFALFLLGLFLGSFVLVLIERIPRGESVLLARSRCEACGHTLSPFDLIPLVSYVLQKGHCRYCRAKFSAKYPLFELLFALYYSVSMSVLVATLPLMWQEFLLFTFWSVILIGLFALCFIDLYHKIIPFSLIFPLIFIVLLYQILLHPASLLEFVLSGLGAFAFFLFIILITKGRGMGGGDSVFALFMGLLLGFPKTVTALYVAFLTGAIVSIILILWKKKSFRNQVIPFGPFLVLGTYLTLLFGASLTQVLLNLLQRGLP